MFFGQLLDDGVICGSDSMEDVLEVLQWHLTPWGDVAKGFVIVSKDPPKLVVLCQIAHLHQLSKTYSLFHLQLSKNFN